jgi:hypothetical protein
MFSPFFEELDEEKVFKFLPGRHPEFWNSGGMILVFSYRSINSFEQCFPMLEQMMRIKDVEFLPNVFVGLHPEEKKDFEPLLHAGDWLTQRGSIVVDWKEGNEDFENIIRILLEKIEEVAKPKIVQGKRCIVA